MYIAVVPPLSIHLYVRTVCAYIHTYIHAYIRTYVYACMHTRAKIIGEGKGTGKRLN